MSDTMGIDSVHLTKTIERAEDELARLLDWVRGADSRLRFVLPLSTAMLGVIAALMPPPSSWTLLGGISASFAVFFLILSIVFSALSSFPRTTGPLASLIYFGGITSKEISQYETAFRNVSDEDYLSDLLHQCYRNAQIAESKYTWLQRSIGCLFISAIPWAIGLYALYSRG